MSCGLIRDAAKLRDLQVIKWIIYPNGLSFYKSYNLNKYSQLYVLYYIYLKKNRYNIIQ